MAVNPRKLTWQNPDSYTDGSAYAQSDNAGYVISLDGEEAVSVPLAWGTEFEFSILDAYKELKRGNHTVALAVVSKAGMQSAFSAAQTFQIEVAPLAPSNLVVA